MSGAAAAVSADASTAGSASAADARAASRYLVLKPARERERAEAIRAGLIPDPTVRVSLDRAIAFSGTCTEMCPAFEREERAYQLNVDPFETFSAHDRRINPHLAVKAFHRPAAGNEQPLPSDVRPPHVLVRTLDYLLRQLLPAHPLARTHAFIRDRTRAIRQDFTLQNERGPIAIACHEKIARYHILSLHVLCEESSFAAQQELEQLSKVLQSLNEFYDDLRLSSPSSFSPNEAEFRAYHLLVHLRDVDTVRAIQALPPALFHAQPIQHALRFHALAQRANERSGQRSRPPNSEASQNHFVRFFRLIRDDPRTTYLFACMLEHHFPDIRRGALKALRKAYMQQHTPLPIDVLSRMLGTDDVLEAANVAEHAGLKVKYDEEEMVGVDVVGDPVPLSVLINRTTEIFDAGPPMTQRSSQLVERKRNHRSYADIIYAEQEQSVQAVAVAASAAMVMTPLATPQPSLQSTPASAVFPSSSQIPLAVTHTAAPVPGFAQSAAVQSETERPLLPSSSFLQPPQPPVSDLRLLPQVSTSAPINFSSVPSVQTQISLEWKPTISFNQEPASADIVPDKPPSSSLQAMSAISPDSAIVTQQEGRRLSASAVTRDHARTTKQANQVDQRNTIIELIAKQLGAEILHSCLGKIIEAKHTDLQRQQIQKRAQARNDFIHSTSCHLSSCILEDVLARKIAVRFSVALDRRYCLRSVLKRWLQCLDHRRQVRKDTAFRREAFARAVSNLNPTAPACDVEEEVFDYADPSELTPHHDTIVASHLHKVLSNSSQSTASQIIFAGHLTKRRSLGAWDMLGPYLRQPAATASPVPWSTTLLEHPSVRVVRRFRLLAAHKIRSAYDELSFFASHHWSVPQVSFDA